MPGYSGPDVADTAELRYYTAREVARLLRISLSPHLLADTSVSYASGGSKVAAELETQRVRPTV